ncbi:hypothetical protein FVE85_6732 [Porphyridium purpureum]|uniref:Uncharacterized protein n=1 Tax=Porphyridium purpureum TaxID=35688 RepID=A0A5J4Z909_PORPP|nr:hypothetical protein FVE85_6732 [Porphyridium purpureum]|eukprot:POR8864..scf295_1
MQTPIKLNAMDTSEYGMKRPARGVSPLSWDKAFLSIFLLLAFFLVQMPGTMQVGERYLDAYVRLEQFENPNFHPPPNPQHVVTLHEYYGIETPESGAQLELRKDATESGTSQRRHVTTLQEYYGLKGETSADTADVKHQKPQDAKPESTKRKPKPSNDSEGSGASRGAGATASTSKSVLAKESAQKSSSQAPVQAAPAPVAELSKHVAAAKIVPHEQATGPNAPQEMAAAISKLSSKGFPEGTAVEQETPLEVSASWQDTAKESVHTPERPKEASAAAVNPASNSVSETGPSSTTASLSSPAVQQGTGYAAGSIRTDVPGGDTHSSGRRIELLEVEPVPALGDGSAKARFRNQVPAQEQAAASDMYLSESGGDVASQGAAQGSLDRLSTAPNEISRRASETKAVVGSDGKVILPEEPADFLKPFEYHMLNYTLKTIRKNRVRVVSDLNCANNERWVPYLLRMAKLRKYYCMDAEQATLDRLENTYPEYAFENVTMKVGNPLKIWIPTSHLTLVADMPQRLSRGSEAVDFYRRLVEKNQTELVLVTSHGSIENNRFSRDEPPMFMNLLKAPFRFKRGNALSINYDACEHVEERENLMVFRVADVNPATAL